MALDVVEDDKMLLVGAFELMRVSQVVINPNGDFRFGEFMIDLNFKHCRRRCQGHRGGNGGTIEADGGLEGSDLSRRDDGLGSFFGGGGLGQCVSLSGFRRRGIPGGGWRDRGGDDGIDDLSGGRSNVCGDRLRRG